MTGATTWRPAPVPETAARLEAAGVDPLLAPILARRGVEGADGADAFLNPDLDQLHEPRLLAGMKPALERLVAAREQQEKVAIVGDYDVDGVTATAMLQVAFKACGLRSTAILPDRMAEGYGFQPVHVERAEAEECRVIVTADCGVTSHRAVAAAVERGIDVIVTDHHLPGAEPLPGSAVLINPKQGQCSYPFGELSGAGLAFKLSLALLEVVRGEEPDPMPFLRIACLGTIADLVPLVGENRAIAALGLHALEEVRSPGLLALMREAAVTRPVTAVDVGFRLGPRLNAAGRLDSAHTALELLLTRDRRRSAELARQLDQWNRRRQDEEMKVVEEARETITRQGVRPGELPPVLVEWSEGWHRGVVGIAAGRLAKEFHRPTVLLAVEGNTATGSGRSIGSIELHRFLEPWRAELLRFGGHSQAVGLSAAVDRLESLRVAWRRAAGQWPVESLERRYEYELEIPLSLVGWELLAAFEALEPHGQANPRPLLKVGPLRLAGAPRLFGKSARKHLGGRLVAAKGNDGASVDFVAWGWGERKDALRGRFEILAYLERDHYRQAPCLRLVDCRPVETP